MSIQRSLDPVDRLRGAVCRLADLTRDRPRSGLAHDDADDVVGTVSTDDAVGFDPLPLLRALHEQGARVVVMGQVAGIMHGSGELTGDLDLLWDGDADHAGAVAAAFASQAATLTDTTGARLACDLGAFALPKVLFRTEQASGDCCTPALSWGNLPVRAFLERCCVARADVLEIRYLRVDDLISMRQAAGRVKDVRRAQELRTLAARRASRS